MVQAQILPIQNPEGQRRYLIEHDAETLTWLRHDVDRFRRGYPRMAAFLSTHGNFQLCRSFTRTRMRLILLKQNEIVRLERSLDKIDNDEIDSTYLYSSARDANEERKRIVTELYHHLAEYGMKTISQTTRTWLKGIRYSHMGYPSDIFTI